jgi:hypothetical protein
MQHNNLWGKRLTLRKFIFTADIFEESDATFVISKDDPLIQKLLTVTVTGCVRVAAYLPANVEGE